MKNLKGTSLDINAPKSNALCPSIQPPFRPSCQTRPSLAPLVLRLVASCSQLTSPSTYISARHLTDACDDSRQWGWPFCLCLLLSRIFRRRGSRAVDFLRGDTSRNYVSRRTRSLLPGAYPIELRQVCYLYCTCRVMKNTTLQIAGEWGRDMIGGTSRGTGLDTHRSPTPMEGLRIRGHPR